MEKPNYLVMVADQHNPHLSTERALVHEWTASHPVRESERWAMPAGVNYRAEE